MANFTQWSHYLLFDGEWIMSTDLPWTYLPKWLLYTSPLGVLLGLLFTVTVNREQRRAVILLAAAALFPWIYAVIKGSVLYDGMRHFLFIYPLGVILAAGGWTNLIRIFRQRQRLGLVIVVCLAVFGFADPVRFHIKNHPNQVVYFNPLLGGVSGAFANFELDYWGNCYAEAVDWIEANHIGESYSVAGSGSGVHAIALYGSRFPRFRFAGNDLGANYYIVVMRDSPARLRELVESPRIIHRVTADGVPLCIVESGD